MRKPRGYWTLETISTEAQKYSSRKEFQINNASAYNKAVEFGIINKVMSHEDKKMIYWTEEMLCKEAIKFKSRTEFSIGNSGAYQAACKMNMDKICEHMKPNFIFWNEKLCRKEALKYKNRTDFMRKCPAGYGAARRLNVIDEVCLHMPYLGENKNYKWREEQVREEAKKYNTRKEFQINNASAYHSARKLGFLEDICSHMEIKRKKWTEAQLREEALKYNSRSEFQYENESAYKQAVSKGLLEIICQHMNRKTWKKIWDQETVNIEALKYEKRTEFSRKSRSAYLFAKENGFLEDICRHMPVFTTDWTEGLIKNEANKYKTRTDFQEGSPNACTAARKLNIMDKICDHMEYEKSGFNKDKSAIVYYLRLEQSDCIPLYKIGITNNHIKERIHSMGLFPDTSWKLITSFWFETGKEAYDLEQLILTEYQEDKYYGDDIMKNGNTELFVRDIFNMDKEI